MTAVYLEGALRRALNPRQVIEYHLDEPSFDEPASLTHVVSSRAPTREAVLDPFAVYANEGEGPLRDRLGALSAWHLVNIVEAYALSRDSAASLNRMSGAALIDRIVAGVRSNRTRASRRSAS